MRKYGIDGIAAFAVFSGSAALGIVLWLQFDQGIAPCSLCIDQRLADLLMIASAAGAILWRGGMRPALLGVAALAALGGAAAGAWQWHLVAMAPQVESCSAVRFLETPPAWGPWGSDFAASLSGQGSCVTAGSKRWLGLPITHWSVLVFTANALLLGFAACGALTCQRPSK
ncbi:disulfide bond formation protein B [Acidithiobacillus sp. VAN18-1]|uniref:Disulfide bond formation protein B n=1 Tax=Igneacidithiobacillus copahuensis TaxID=2724909 RepID=A0AAE2YR28_9PROT|nr:disulfide bond formation protein B [Igneacidithiobacillus copahuensis]MBU2788634.1 disulfide bond formation protein B [Igneacidithiobacillus copahuensis]MBU2796682.1 disulfide bond formation protein B [Acidithiobacillus sp. VAN18-2]